MTFIPGPKFDAPFYDVDFSRKDDLKNGEKWIKSLIEQGNKPELTGDEDMDKLLAECISTMKTKGQEYTGNSPDRLNNFREAGKDIGLGMEQVWYTYFNKHLRALQSYIKNDCKTQSNESIQGRIVDLINYLLLFGKMTIEIERGRAPAERK